MWVKLILKAQVVGGGGQGRPCLPQSGHLGKAVHSDQKDVEKGSQVKSRGCPSGQDWPHQEVGEWAWQFGDLPLAWPGWGEERDGAGCWKRPDLT